MAIPPHFEKRHIPRFWSLLNGTSEMAVAISKVAFRPTGGRPRGAQAPFTSPCG